ncbi:AAA family ATPase [Bailinhaonella thermotolerans]|nr:AAA family ATPase [Bailinhaonella thermotolerans]
MAKHDREDPHSLEEQLAWLDALSKEGAAEPGNGVPAEGEVSPYPRDPWSAVPAVRPPVPPPMFRAGAETAQSMAEPPGPNPFGRAGVTTPGTVERDTRPAPPAPPAPQPPSAASPPVAPPEFGSRAAGPVDARAYGGPEPSGRAAVPRPDPRAAEHPPHGAETRPPATPPGSDPRTAAPGAPAVPGAAAPPPGPAAHGADAPPAPGTGGAETPAVPGTPAAEERGGHAAAPPPPGEAEARAVPGAPDVEAGRGSADATVADAARPESPPTAATGAEPSAGPDPATPDATGLRADDARADDARADPARAGEARAGEARAGAAPRADAGNRVDAGAGVDVPAGAGSEAGRGGRSESEGVPPSGHDARAVADAPPGARHGADARPGAEAAGPGSVAPPGAGTRPAADVRPGADAYSRADAHPGTGAPGAPATSVPGPRTGDGGGLEPLPPEEFPVRDVYPAEASAGPYAVTREDYERTRPTYEPPAYAPPTPRAGERPEPGDRQVYPPPASPAAYVPPAYEPAPAPYEPGPPAYEPPTGTPAYEPPPAYDAPPPAYDRPAGRGAGAGAYEQAPGHPGYAYDRPAAQDRPGYEPPRGTPSYEAPDRPGYAGGGYGRGYDRSYDAYTDYDQPRQPGADVPQTADSLDPMTLLRDRPTPPSTGWRRLVYRASGGLIRPGESPVQLRRRELIMRARTPVAGGHHRVAVLSLKGGVGKTTTTVGLGAMLAQIRGDRVIAVDANPDRGTLSDKVELETAATVRDLLNEREQIQRYADVRAFTSQSSSRLEVLASDRDPAVSEAFSEADYRAVARVLEHFYSICITDCGTGLLHSAMSGVLGLADQIVLVSSPSVDGARAASATLDWLEAHHYGDLVRAATVVLSTVRPRSKSTVDLERLEAHFASRCRAVVRVPYDSHLEEGAEIDLELLQAPTREAYLQLAATVGDGFARLPRT